MSAPVLEIRNVTVAFGGVLAVQDLSFAVTAGEILGVIGPNGAGKTTCFNVISGLVRPRSGRVLLDGRDITALPAHRITRLGASRTFQTARPFADLTARENVEVGLQFGRGHRAGDGGHVTADQFLHFVGLPPDDPRPVSECDFMTRRCVELARALASRPRVLLLDEILAGLNPAEIGAVAAILDRIRSEFDVTVVWVEHIMDTLMAVATRVVVLHHGSKLAEGRPSEVVNDPRVVEVYLGRSKVHVG